jgi:L-lysine exporter family protein LysE/ArgO
MSGVTTVAVPAVEGFALGATLIIAIGAQNAFVLRQGLVGAHAGAVATVCAVSDGLLIFAGIAGLGSLIRAAPGLLTAITIGGAVFLLVYGAMAAYRALKPRSGKLPPQAQEGLAAAIGTCLALTFLNPHVYLDTVVLIGGLSARYEGAAVLMFGGGAALASLTWFFGLAYGARLAAPLFARPGAWRILDALVAATMLIIAARLIGEVWGG